MKGKRKHRTAGFKAQLALGALKGSPDAGSYSEGLHCYSKSFSFSPASFHEIGKEPALGVLVYVNLNHYEFFDSWLATASTNPGTTALLPSKN